MPYADSAPEKEPRLKMDDDEILQVVRAERQMAVGIEPGDDVFDSREQALDYFKGDMTNARRGDPIAFPGRSAVVSSDLSDAVLTALPDLVEIFTSEEIGSFRPIGQNDVDRAKQETKVVNHVILNENDSFEFVHDAIQDALLTKVGVLYFYAEQDKKEEEEVFQNQSPPAILAAQQAGDEVFDVAEQGDGLYSFKARRSKLKTKICIKAVASEDFAVSRDTINLRDTPYCVARVRLRAYVLKEMGIDAELVDDLPGYSAQAQEEQDIARDVAGEHSSAIYGTEATHDMRLVQVWLHVVRMDADGDGASEIWRVLTDEKEGVLLDKERLSRVPFAGGAPYRQAHRWYGRSLADLLIEVQKIKTSLLRMALDEGYFGLNQRTEVDMSGATEDTIDDLLNNRPGAPVRVKRQGTVTPIQSGGLAFDAFEALEYVTTVGEQRSGVVRGMQGLDPDTLHETKGGMLAMMAAAQRRLRFVGKTLGEVMFKDLFVGVHDLLRQYGGQEMAVPDGEEWITASPTSWAQRDSFDISIGRGIEHDLALLTGVGADAAAIVQGQGGLSGPVVTPQNAANLAIAKWSRAGVKGVERFFTDPSKQPQQQEAPKEDPAVIEAKGKLALQQQEQQHKQQLEQADSQRKDADAAYKLQRQQEIDALEDELRRQKAANEADVAQKRALFEADLAHKKQDQEYDLAIREQDINQALKLREIGINADLREEEIEKEHALGHVQAAADHDVAMTKADNDAKLPKNRPGGELDE